MTLSEILAIRSNVPVKCTACGSHTSAYIPAMIDKHHPDTDFDVALRRHVCLICGEMRGFRYLKAGEYW